MHFAPKAVHFAPEAVHFARRARAFGLLDGELASRITSQQRSTRGWCAASRAIRARATSGGAALALTFDPRLRRPSLAPPVALSETQERLAGTGIAHTRPLPQAPSPPLSASTTQDFAQAPRAPLPPITVTGQPGVPMRCSGPPTIDPTVARPRWWMAAVPALVILGGLVTLTAWQGVFDDEPRRRHTPPGPGPLPMVVPVPVVPVPGVGAPGVPVAGPRDHKDDHDG